MSDPFYRDVLKILLGAIIALFSSFIMEGLKIRINRKQQIQFFKLTLIDDLSEVCGFIHDMRETFTRTQVISDDYLKRLVEVEQRFWNQRHDNLYMINESELRRNIKSSYASLRDKIKASQNRVNTLGEKNDGHNNIISEFTSLEADMKPLQEKIKKYKFCIFYYIY